MPEWLMGTDCKFVGNMSTLVQIQLGPRIHRSIMRLDNINNIINNKFVMPKNSFYIRYFNIFISFFFTLINKIIKLIINIIINILNIILTLIIDYLYNKNINNLNNIINDINNDINNNK